MSDMTIVVPSHHRPDRVDPAKYLPHESFVVCVAEYEAEEYRRSNPGIEIVEHPNSVVGVSAKRQWILDHFGDVFMLDDDCWKMISNERITGEPTSIEGDRAVRIIQRLYELAVEADLYVFGFGPQILPVMAYDGRRPFRLEGTIYGYSMGVRAGGDLWFNKRIQVIDDMWILALNAHFHRITLLDRRFSFMHRKDGGAMPQVGGMAEHRTFERYLEDLDVLREHFGAFADIGLHGVRQEIVLRDYDYPWLTGHRRRRSKESLT